MLALCFTDSLLQEIDHNLLDRFPVSQFVEWYKSWQRLLLRWMVGNFAANNVVVRDSRKNLHSKDEVGTVGADQIEGVGTPSWSFSRLLQAVILPTCLQNHGVSKILYLSAMLSQSLFDRFMSPNVGVGVMDSSCFRKGFSRAQDFLRRTRRACNKHICRECFFLRNHLHGSLESIREHLVITYGRNLSTVVSRGNASFNVRFLAA